MEAIDCRTVRSSLWDFAAGNLGGDITDAVTSHLQDCRECRCERAEVSSLRTGLKQLPHVNLSPLLATRLQVIASREHSRQMRRRDFEAWKADFSARAKLFFDNLLRPVAVPAAGGILASVFCFGMIVDSLQVGPVWQNDIPVGLFTQVMLDDASPFAGTGNDVIVQLTVDENGRVSDFALPQGNASPAELQEIGNLVLYSTFTPATAFGQRIAGKILVGIQHINVRG